MRNSNPTLASSDKGFTLILMLSSLVVISLLYLLVGSSHQVQHKDAQKEILYTSDNAIMPPVNTTLNQDDLNKMKEKERLDQLNSLNNKMKQAEGILDTYSSLGSNHKIFKFTGKKFFTSLTTESLAEKSIKYRDEGSALPSFSCNYWAVVTTSRPLSSTIEKFITYNKWCLVVVGDQKGEKLYFSDDRNSTTAEVASSSFNYFYLSYEDQIVNLASRFSLINTLPVNHLSRKMIGYLFALQHGALVIYDYDDTQSITSNPFKHGILSWIRDQTLQLKSSGVEGNQKMEREVGRRRLRQSSYKRRLNSHSASAQGLDSNTSDSGGGGGVSTGRALIVNELLNISVTFINSFSLLGTDHRPAWPRGFPINALQPSDGPSSPSLTEDTDSLTSTVTLKSKEVAIDSIGVIHFLSNHHADVDRRYEMIFSQPFHFPVKGQLPFLLPKMKTFAPYNTLSTVFFQSMLWSLYLPISINSRFTDVIRSYITERVLQEMNGLYAVAQKNVTNSQRKEIRILFHSPVTVRQRIIKDADRNPSSPIVSSFDGNNTTQQEKRGNLWGLQGLTKDYHSDIILTILVNELQSLTLKSATVPGMLEEVYIFLYEIGFLEKTDVAAVQQWLQHLLELNYVFPSLPRPRVANPETKKEEVRREDVALNLINS